MIDLLKDLIPLLWKVLQIQLQFLRFGLGLLLRRGVLIVLVSPVKCKLALVVIWVIASFWRLWVAWRRIAWLMLRLLVRKDVSLVKLVLRELELTQLLRRISLLLRRLSKPLFSKIHHWKLRCRLRLSINSFWLFVPLILEVRQILAKRITHWVTHLDWRLVWSLLILSWV